jgi:hypothetical protein
MCPLFLLRAQSENKEVLNCHAEESLSTEANRRRTRIQTSPVLQIFQSLINVNSFVLNAGASGT